MALTKKQQQAIVMAFTEGSWSAIAEKLKVHRTTIWEWRQKPEWKKEFERCHKIMSDEVLMFGGEKLQEAYQELLQLGLNKKVNSRDRVTALTNFIDRVKGNKTDKTVSEIEKAIIQLKDIAGEDDATI